MPQRAQRSLIFISIAVFLAGVGVWLAGLGGQTHVWRGSFLVALLLSSSINGITGMALGIWLWGYCRAVRDRGESIWLPWTMGTFCFLNGLALLTGSGTPFAPRPLAIGLLLFAIFIRLVSAAFAVWNFPRLRRSLKDEGRRLTRAQMQADIDKLKADLDAARGHAEQATSETNNDAVKHATTRINSALSKLDHFERQLGRLEIHDGFTIGRGANAG